MNGPELLQIDRMIARASADGERAMLIQVPESLRAALDRAIGALLNPELGADTQGDRQFRYRRCWIGEAAISEPAILLVCESGKIYF